MLIPRFIIGFTGHRSGYEESTVRVSLRQALETLQKQAQAAGGQAELYTSIAEGADTLCVEIARELKMPVHLLLPLAEPEFEKDFSRPTAWERAKAQLEIARQRPGPDSVHLVPGEHSRPDCYFNQGVHMLEICDVLLSVSNSNPSQGAGGTAEIVQLALAMRVPNLNVRSTDGEVFGLSTVYFKCDPVIDELNHLAIQEKLPCAQAEATPMQLQQCLDTLAKDESRGYRPWVVIIILLHGIAALLAAIAVFNPAVGYTSFMSNKWMFTGIELALVTYAAYLSWKLHRRRRHEHWLQCRFACELVRGFRASVPLLDPLHPQIHQHDPSWTRFALSSGLLCQAHQPTHDLLALRQHYLHTRLDDDLVHSKSTDEPNESQIIHYRSRRPSAVRWWKITGLVGKWSAALAPFFVCVSLLNKTLHWHWERSLNGWLLVAFLPIALPMLAGVASGIRQALDASRRSHRYPQMVERLTTIKSVLPSLKTQSTIAHTVNRTEEILLDELIEWHLAAKHGGGH